MTKITEILGKKFTRSVELVPLRNWENPQDLLSKVGQLKELGIDFISVTKGAGGSLRGGTLFIAYFSRERYGMECIAHFTCMDSTIHQIENRLMNYHNFRIENILALRGDVPDAAPDLAGKCPKYTGDHKYAYQLAHQITELNQGHYLTRKGFDAEADHTQGPSTDFCIGVAAHPEEADMEKALSYFKKKVEEGAHYAITQMIFDAELYKRFVSGARDLGITIPILPGICPLTNYDQAVRIETKFHVPIPEKFKQALRGLDEAAAYKKGVELTAGLCDEMREAGAPGTHLFVMNNVDITRDILALLG